MDRSVGLPNSISPHVVNIVEDVWGQHCRRNTAGNAPSPGHQNQCVTKTARQVDVMECDYRRRIETTEQAHQLELMMDVEMISRLIHYDHTGLLSKRPRDRYPLSLTAGNPRKRTSFKVFDFHNFHRA